MKRISALLITFSFFLLQSFASPQASQKWESLQYDKIAPNKVSVLDPAKGQGLIKIEVKNSSSPTIRSFTKPQSFDSVFVKGKITGSLNLPKDANQFEVDDFTLRVGLVLAGDKRLNWAQRQLPKPKWVTRMFSMAPKGTGIKNIYFLNVGHFPLNKNPKLNQRAHPLSKYLYEEIMVSAKTGEFQFTKKFDQPEKLLGLWLSANGEHTNSSFSVTIDQIKINSSKKVAQTPDEI